MATNPDLIERHRLTDVPSPTVALTRGLGRVRWFPRPGGPRPSAAAREEPSLNSDEARRASLVARLASRLMAGFLSDPANRAVAEGAVRPMVRMAREIELEARRAVADPVAAEEAAPLPGPSPQATAWQAGYRDGEAGRAPRFLGPRELEGDYWDGMNVARSDCVGRAAND